MTETSYLTAYDVSETGYLVVAALNSPDEWVGKTIVAVGDHMHPQEYVKIWSDVIGKPARYQAITPEVFASFGFPGAEELGHMFAYFNEYGLFPADWDASSGKKAYPKLRTWKEWLQAGKW